MELVVKSRKQAKPAAAADPLWPTCPKVCAPPAVMSRSDTDENQLGTRRRVTSESPAGCADVYLDRRVGTPARVVKSSVVSGALV